jgi:predicted ribosome quality control (RQC) complex YloA/Tae2 family protein
LDNLVLIRVVSALDSGLRRAVLTDVIEESHHRVRFVFQVADRPRSVIVSLRPELPWIGRATGRWEARRKHSIPIGTALRSALGGGVLARIVRPGPDRIVRLEFADGKTVVVELATHRANLILLDREACVIAVARRPRSAQTRLEAGTLYSPPPLPSHLFLPYGRSAEEIDAALETIRAREDDPFESLRRHLFGIGTEGARLVVAEARQSGRSTGEVLSDRLAGLEAGRLEPVIISPGDPLEAALSGRMDPLVTRLLPWKPEGDIDFLRRGDAAATAGLYHEALERFVQLRDRARGLRAIVERELRRAHAAERSAARDRASFRDPQTHQRWGEALLAGLRVARRIGEVAMVPDPYDARAGEIAVPARPGLELSRVATEHFRLSRRARRGIKRAEQRLEELGERVARLQRLAERDAELPGADSVRTFEQAMLDERIPVGLEPDRRARATARLTRPRLERVRVYRAADGSTILAGRSSRENERLTFRLASPEDFWLHAEDSPGAHVILRNAERDREPPETALRQAAGVAAWFSEARNEKWVTVQWTQRKNVRKPRGSAPGRVTIKRCRTVRVHPGLPEDEGPVIR